MKKKDEIKVCLVGSSGGHLTHLYMLKPFWKDKNRFWVTFDKEDLPRFFDYSTELSYSKTERVTCIEDITVAKNAIIWTTPCKESLQLVA